MKRVVLVALMIVFLAGCNFSFNFDGFNDKEEEMEDIQLQISKIDKDSGTTVENNEVYQELENILNENPDLGVQGDFTIHVITDMHMETGEWRLLFLGVNRLNVDIENIEFDLTLGSESEQVFVYEDTYVTLDNDELGPIKSGHAMPFTLPVTEEEINFYGGIPEEDRVFEIDNFKFDEAK